MKDFGVKFKKYETVSDIVDSILLSDSDNDSSDEDDSDSDDEDMR